MPGRSRRELLAAHGLAAAPRRLQELFWISYNRRLRGAPDAIGKVAEKALSLGKEAEPEAIDRVGAAWLGVVPAELAACSRIESLIGGRLKVLVSNAAAAFACRRQLGDGVAGRLNEKLGSPLIRGVDYRVGPVGKRKLTPGRNRVAEA